MNTIKKSPFIPLLQRGKIIPLYLRGVKGCVPLFGRG